MDHKNALNPALNWPRPGDVVPYDPGAWGTPAPATRSFHLFVRPGGTDEFVATLEATPPRSFAWWPEMLVVKDYNRDEAVMAHFNAPSSLSSSSSSGYVVNCATLRAVCGNDPRKQEPQQQQQQQQRQAVKKVADFARFLRDRGKAGVVAVNAVGSASRIFVLPGHDDAAGELRLLRFVVMGGRAASAPSLQQQQQQQRQQQQRQAQAGRPRGAAVPVAVAAKSKGGGGDSSDGTGGSGRSSGGGGGGGAAAVAAHREKARKRLESFHADESAERLEFEVMDDMGRYIVVEEVEEFRGELVDDEEGVMLDEKYVVVYKRDRLPHDIAVKFGLARAEDSGREADEAAAAAAAAAAMAQQQQQDGGDVDVGDLVVIGQQKRDRRTVNDIMLETEEVRNDSAKRPRIT